ncbi:MAG: T9SS type A sorting domain-containing protein [Ignavibacteriae bacterium]|nr:T9SS type A sorting domain-containing protein [Ignavibacteriota bacterium]
MLSEGAQPFTYNAAKNTLVTIKRGYVNTDSFPSYSGENTKDNLFLLKSKDWGHTWSQPKLLYNSKTDGGGDYGTARYPSVFSFIYEDSPDSLAHVYTAITNKSTGWYGYIDGLYDGTSYYAASSVDFQSGGNTYVWSNGYDIQTRVLGTLKGTDALGIGVGGVIPPTGNPTESLNNFATRKTIVFDEWLANMPPQWTTDKFNPANSRDSIRSSSITDFKIDDNKKMYVIVVGNFVNDTYNDRMKIGVSTSSDFGETWTDFDICSHQLVRDYATAKGFDPDSAFVNYTNQGIALFNNGDISTMGLLFDGAIDGISQPDSLQLREIVELYRENNNWGIRKIADHSGTFINYKPYPAQGDPSNNQLGYEMQMTRTVDGNALLCKYIVVYYTFNVNTQQNEIYTTDVFVNGRYKNSSSWGEPINITNSDEFDKITWLPDLVPNGLNSVPLLKLQSMYAPGDDDATKKDKQLYNELYNQYVQIGFFDAHTVLDVNETNDSKSEIQITSIYPNPADNNAEFNFILPNNAKYEISVSDLMGRVVKNMISGVGNEGLQSVKLNTADLPQGAYYCTISSNGQRATKMITIIR